MTVSKEDVERALTAARAHLVLDPIGVHTCSEAQQLSRALLHLAEENGYLRSGGVHSCHANCKQPPCVVRRERDQLRSEVARLEADNAALRGSLKTILDYLDSGELCRDISKDHLPDWSIRMMHLVSDLKAAKDAIDKPAGKAMLERVGKLEELEKSVRRHLEHLGKHGAADWDEIDAALAALKAVEEVKRGI